MKRLAFGILVALLLCLSLALIPAQEKKGPRALPAVDQAAPEKIETATLALGWFWEPESQFGILPGVIRTRVGYTGGTLKNPTYYKLGDHTETFQVDFDPAKTSYEKILAVYWSTHNHCAVPNNRQYMSAVFYAGDAQKKTALQTRERAAAKSKQRLTTVILPLKEFYLAEGYHQKHMLRQRPDLLGELTEMYPQEKDFFNSTAAARINGFLGGNGTHAQLEGEIDGFGLSARGRSTLLSLVKRNGK